MIIMSHIDGWQIPEISDDLLNSELRRVFGLQNFYPEQLSAIRSLLEGRDSVTLMPTGAGKSLIYQFPSLLFVDGIALVISPLIALMNEQVGQLNKLGIGAMSANSSMDELEQRTAFARAVTGKIKILFLSPERALGGEFNSLLEKIKINYIAIDEAHCISRWGHDFRPEYRQLAKLRKKLKKRVPLMALTATATEKVLGDVIDNLGMVDPAVIRKSFFRSNLIFSVLFTDTDSEKNQILLELLRDFYLVQKKKGKSIIYCSTRKKVDDICKLLRANGLDAVHYHAGRTGSARISAHQKFSSGKKSILVATNAFGMGMDEPDVRRVIHYNLPASLDSYYQEAGRAGRDSENSECILFYRKSDLNTHRFLAMKSSSGKESSQDFLERMENYALTAECRQRALCGYFGESVENCGVCDNCRGFSPERSEKIKSRKREILEKAQKAVHAFSDEERQIIMNSIIEADGAFGKSGLIKILRGEKIKTRKKFDPESFQHYGTLHHIQTPALNALLSTWLKEKIIESTGNKYPKLTVPGGAKKIAKKIAKKRTASTTSEGVPSRKDLVRNLKNYRDKEARRLKWKKFMVLQNAVISSIADSLPVTHEELLAIRGLGESKATRFGRELIEIVSNYLMRARK